MLIKIPRRLPDESESLAGKSAVASWLGGGDAI